MSYYLTTYEKIKLPQAVTATSATIKEFISAATELLESTEFCNRNLAERTYENEIHEIRDKESMVLKNYPVSEVTSLQTFGTSTTDVPENYYYIENNNGIIYTKNYFRFFGKYSCSYKAGYAIGSVPDALEKACIMLTQHLYYKSKNFTSNEDGEFPKVVYKLIKPFVGK